MESDDLAIPSLDIEYTMIAQQMFLYASSQSISFSWSQGFIADVDFSQSFADDLPGPPVDK